MAPGTEGRERIGAPYCSRRLADAGARVIEVERRDGDVARGYDRAVHGESWYWVWRTRRALRAAPGTAASGQSGTVSARLSLISSITT